MTRLIMISGSMAAGKSTVAAILVERLRAQGFTVAATALDQIADMARPSLPTWDWAHDIHAKIVGHWARTGIDVVVDEGCSTRVEVQQVLDELPLGTDTFHVVLEAEYEPALRRARADPTRGISKDPTFLRRQYDDFAVEVTRLPQDLRIPVEGLTPSQLADKILRAWTERAGGQSMDHSQNRSDSENS